MTKELINKNIVAFEFEADNKADVIRHIADMMDADGRLKNKEEYIQAVMEREATSSTAIGFSTATPHAKSEAVEVPSLAFVRLKKPIQWDEEQVTIVFQIAVPSPGQGNRHLEILSQLFRNLVYDEFRDKLSAAKNEKEVVDLLAGF